MNTRDFHIMNYHIPILPSIHFLTCLQQWNMTSGKHCVILNDSYYSYIDVYAGLDIACVVPDSLYKSSDIDIDLRDDKNY